MKTLNGIQVLTTIEEVVDPAHTAMIVIDMQNENLSERGGYATTGTDVSSASAIVPNIQRLLESARESGVLVTYVEFVHLNRYDANLMDGPSLFLHRNESFVSQIREGTWAAQTVDELAPQPGDLVFTKSRSSSFRNTPLSSQLRLREVRSLVITGMVTQGCVLHTHADALMEGYYPVVVPDAVASYDADLHHSALHWMSRKGPSLDTDEILGVWNRLASFQQ